MHVATFRVGDLRIYEHPGLPLSSLYLDTQCIQTDTNTNVSLSTRYGHVFSAGALTLDLERSSLHRVPCHGADPGGSFQDTVGYPQRICPFIRTLLYSLQNIVLPSPFWKEEEGREDEEKKEKENSWSGDVRVGVLHVYTYIRLRFVDRP